MTGNGADPQSGLTILVVDDEPAWVGALGALLGRAGHRIVAAYDGDEALRRFRGERVDAVLLDLAMPGMDGAEVCRQMRAESDVPILIVSGERDRSVPAELLDLGADDFVRKGAPSNELLARIRAVMRRRAPSGIDAGSRRQRKAGSSTHDATRSAGMARCPGDGDRVSTARPADRATRRAGPACRSPGRGLAD